MAEEILRQKTKQSQTMGVIGQQFSLLNSSQKVHSHPWATALRSFTVDNVSFGSKNSIVVNSSNMIGECFLLVTLANGNNSNYCKHIGGSLIKDFVIRYSSREIQSDSYSNLVWLTFNKMRGSETREEIIRLMGNVNGSGDNPGQVVCYLPSFFSGLQRDWKTASGWLNSGAQKLEFSLEFAEKSECSAGGDCAITACEMWFEEYYLPLPLERSVAPANRSRVVHDFSTVSANVEANVAQKIDCSSLLASGHCKVLWVRIRQSANVGEFRDPFETNKITSFKLTLNSKEIVHYEDALQCDMSQLLARFHYDRVRNLPFAYSFAVKPSESNIDGMLQSQNSHLVCEITSSVAGECTIICEHLKKIQKGATGRLTKSD